MSYLLGIDIGTSSAKAVVIRDDGEVVFTIAPEYRFATPRPLWAEANPADWWSATVEALQACARAVNPSEIVGLGLTGQMHGLVMLDAAGEVLRPCIMWNDQRTGKQCADLTARVGAEKVLQLTGNPVLPGFTAGKILWVQENEPEVYAKCAKVLLPKDYIRYRLSGEFFSDVSDSSGTSLLDVANRRWSDEMLEAAGVARAWLPEVTESVEASTKLSASAAQLTGLPEGLPIAAGGGDQAAQAVGCGIVKEGVVSCTVGTSGVVFAHAEEYRVEPEGRLHAFCSAVPGKWHLMGVMLSAAGSFAWYADTLGGEERLRAQAEGGNRYDLLTQGAAEVAPGSEGLLFLPYLTGERTPYPDPNATGVFFGLTLRHGKAHLTRAVMEGVTYGLRDSLELMRALGIEPTTVVGSGGGAKSPLWRQMLADNFKAKLVTVNATEGAAYGAAVLAGVGAGVYTGVEDACAQTLKTMSETEPGDAGAVYDRYYPRYQALYPALKDEFAAMGALVADDPAAG